MHCCNLSLLRITGQTQHSGIQAAHSCVGQQTSLLLNLAFQEETILCYCPKLLQCTTTGMRSETLPYFRVATAKCTFQSSNAALPGRRQTHQSFQMLEPADSNMFVPLSEQFQAACHTSSVLMPAACQLLSLTGCPLPVL